MRKSGTQVRTEDKIAINDEGYKKLSGARFQQRYAYFDALATLLVDRFDPASALDTGCGWGHLVYALRKLGVDAYGVDVSKYALTSGVNEVKQYLRWADIDSEGLPFASSSFDLVTCHHAIEHLENLSYFVSEIKRVLKSGGVVFVETPVLPFEASRRLLRALHICASEESIHPNVHSSTYWVRRFTTCEFQHIGDLSSFIRQTCVDLDNPGWWLSDLLLKLGPIGRALWVWLAPYITGTYLFRLPAQVFSRQDSKDEMARARRGTSPSSGTVKLRRGLWTF